MIKKKEKEQEQEIPQLIKHDIELLFRISEERIYRKYQKFYLIGLDEVGRGSIAGPVTTSAICFKHSLEDLLSERSFLDSAQKIKDSKKIKSSVKREQICQFIKERAYYAFDSLDSTEIDKLGISRTTFLSMQNSVFALFSKLTRELDFSKKTLFLILIDGNFIIEQLEKKLFKRFFQGNIQAKVSISQLAKKKADALSFHVACASNFAKSKRDSILEELSKEFPEYLFSKHKGYGTKEHFRKLEESGVSLIHRKSFLKKFFERQQLIKLQRRFSIPFSKEQD